MRWRTSSEVSVRVSDVVHERVAERAEPALELVVVERAEVVRVRLVAQAERERRGEQRVDRLHAARVRVARRVVQRVAPERQARDRRRVLRRPVEEQRALAEHTPQPLPAVAVLELPQQVAALLVLK